VVVHLRSVPDNIGALYTRNITTTGYSSAIKIMTQLYRVQVFPSLLSNPVQHLFPSPRKSLKPIMDAPDFNEDEEVEKCHSLRC